VNGYDKNFLNASGPNGFKKWSIAHPPSSNDDETSIAIAVLALDEPIMALPEQPRRSLPPGKKHRREHIEQRRHPLSSFRI
jgi:hypothetical protein